MVVECIWEPNFEREAKKVYGTLDNTHPGVNYLFNSKNTIYFGGNLKKIKLPNHYDYQHYRFSPNEIKKNI